MGTLRRVAVLALAVAALVPTLPTAAAAPDPGVTEVCRFTDDRFTEISGLARSLRHPGVLWLHNDSGGGPYLYAVDERTCRTLATIRIAGIPARDMEAIATSRDRQGNAVIWVGDIGDNRDSWPYVRLHRILEPAQLVDQTVPATTFRFTYPDGPHNAEALLAWKGRIWVVTKQLAHGGLYSVPLRRSGIATAVRLREEGGMVTDGAVSPDGSRYVLRDYVNARIWDGLPPGRPTGEFPLPFQVQGEAITWTADGAALLIASEADRRLLRVVPPAR